MRSIVRGVVALFAAFCIIDVAKAAPTIVSPTDYSKVSPFSLAFKNIIEDGSLGPDGKFATKDGKIIWSNPYFGYSDYYRTVNGVKETNPNSQRVADRILSRENSLPVTLKWGNSSGSCTVKLWRTKKDTESAPQFTVTTTENSVKFYDLEIGRNYTWTVTDSTGKATGHFYVMNESQAPRILLNDHDPNASGSDTSNTRDIGGYRTYKGSKVIKQGLIYRTAELEWCNPVDAAGIRQELTYLKNTIGIKYDIDFRDHADMTSTAELGYAGSSSKWKWAWKNGSYLNLNESNIGAGIPRLNINKLTGTQFGSYTGLVPKKSGTTTANKNNRKNVWCAFTNVADSAKWPLVFHCSHGKDRAGTFALVLHGVLDIPKEIALKDFAYSWFDSPDETLNPVNMANTITNLFSYTSYSSNNDADYRFKEQCYNFLVQCGKDAGVTEANAKAKIDSFITAMTEDAEEPDVNPALSTNRETDGDTFSYTTIYHRRNAGGGSLGSDNGSTLNYIYSSSTTTSTHAPKGNLNTYNTCLCFWPVDGLPYSSPVCGYYLMGKIVTYGRYAPAGAGPYNLKAYFRSEGHSLVDRTIIEHRSGVGNYENVDLYFTPYDSSKPGEKYLNGSYVYGTSDTGTAAIEVWANATMRVRDIRDMSQKNTKAKRYKVYLKFPKGSCDNARFESLEIDGDGENLLGWFTGGEVGTRQYVKVVNSILQFNAPGKTSGVEGALGLEFSLGGVNTTSSAAMLKVAGTLNINAGSTITVDAGRKGAGTYKLVSAGTLNDYANLAFNYSVDNCAKGYYGVVVRDGNNLNLVVQEGEPLEEDPEDIGDADEGDWGYRVRGLGALKNETALVFTNSAKMANWVIPSKLENVQFLVVGGGGGGGADTCASDAYSGGGGGGGGGVVTGLVSFAEESYVTITVGKGGAGGTEETKYNSQYGASASGGNSMFITSDGLRATAFGGGGSGGISGGTKVRTTVESGPAGGSTAGGRAKSDANKNTFAGPVATATKGEVAGITVFGTMGNNGGESTGNYAGAGGGGAMGKGGDTTGDAANGGPGYESNITGTRAVYGSGGGGSVITGVGGLGGEGAGNGNSSAGASGTDGLANQGGGGGAGGRGDLDSVTKGGNGGSGIVVLRYVDPTSAPVDPENPDIKLIAEPAVIPNLVFNGNEQNGVITGEGYTLSGVTKAESAGTYEAIATLKTGYKWLDGTTEPKTITWSIAKFTNIWTIEPSISLSSWITGATPGELNMGVAKFGTVTATMNGAAFTGLPTAVGTYSIVCTVEATSNYTALSETITFEILEVPVINPTEYGKADSAASTYTWIGHTGPWMYTTNWTATAAGTYGVPNNGTYATADFPATLVNAFTCTLNQNVSVNKAEFNSPNMTFVLDNALLTLKGKVDSYAACDFGDGENDNSTIELRGANAGIVSASNEVRLNFGYRHGDVTPTGTVTVRFVVPETGWESDARIKATGRDSKVVFYENSKLEIDATALGVPAEGTTKTVYLASGTGDNGVYVSSSATNIVCAAGAKGSIKIENKKLVLTVEADETTEPDEPQEPQLTAVDAPVAQAGLVYTGSELTGVVSATGYTLAGNTATDAGNYTAIATLAEGYKWSDGTTGNKEISWSIAKATNEWTTEPKISLESWTQGEAAGVLTSGVAKFGTVTASMTELPTEVGSYTITYTVAETKNYTGLNATVQFEIKEMVAPGDLIAVKPTVNYASGTKFTAIGVEQKPILTPASGEGYKVSYEGDFTSSGTHKIIITLDNNWKWSDGSSDTLVFQYTFVNRNFTKEFYASGSGRFQSSSRWYNKALTTKLNAYPTDYTHKAYSTTTSSSAHMDDALETKVGMFVVSGGEYKLTYGVLNFQNETVTPLPMWVTEPGCMTTIQATKMPLNGGGVGYFELGAGATNRFGLVDASENFYIRYATDGDLGSVTEFYDSGDSPVNTKLGWFEGGAEGIVSELIVTNTSVNFAKVGAVNGVAGPLAVTVALGENNIERPSIDVAGTLKINQGSTLNINANGMPCGVYTIITAGEFIGADILTTDQSGAVTGLAENTSGVIEREGNTIKLYIETTILPTVPGIDGESVSINDVFNSARVSKPIWYKTRPEIIDGKIVFNRIPVEIPEYYNVSIEALAEGYLIKLVLKDNLTPYIGNKVDDDVVTTPAIKVENGKVKIHLEGTHKKLHYSLMTSTSVDPSATWTTADGDWTDNANFEFGDGVQRLDDVRFFKVGEVSDEPIE